MKKTAIVYYSVHHGNTKKLIAGISSEFNIDVFDVKEAKTSDLSKYEIIGLASGIYAGGMHRGLLNIIDTKLSTGQKVFIAYTAGILFKNYARKLVSKLKEKNIPLLGRFACKGFNTFGPFKFFGGISNGHPDEIDIKNFNIFLKTQIN